MRLYQAGDRSAGICGHCRCKVETRMTYIDFTPAGTHLTVPDVLIGVCEQCGMAVGIPYQSTPKINEYRNPAPRVRETIRSRIPRVLDESLDLVTASFGGGLNPTYRPAMMRYYLDQVANDPDIAAEVEGRSMTDLARGKVDCRMEFEISAGRWAAAWSVGKAAGMTRKKQLLGGVAALIVGDYEVSLKGKTRYGPAAAKPSKGARARIAFLRELVASI